MAPQTDEQVNKEYGWLPLPADPEARILLMEPGDAKPVPVKSLADLESMVQTPPNTALAKEVLEYAQKVLPVETLNHSIRCYVYGILLLKQFYPHWSVSHETYFVSCMLHDLGTVPTNQTSTRLSFDFHGALLANDLLQALKQAPSPPQAQREAVVEAIIRHQDVAGSEGMTTTLTGLLQMTTLLDNAGQDFDRLVTPETVKVVTEKYPRMKWCGCFADVVRAEIKQKPWANSTRVPDFTGKVEAKHKMREFD